MREQVIASRGSRSRGAAAQPRGFVQRPARRGNVTGAQARNFSPRALFGYVPWALKFILGILAVIFLIVGYRVAASAALFQVRSIDVTGTSRVSAEEVEGLTRRAAARTGVWRADLSAISVELGRLPGVRRAVVSRVLPDRLRVRVVERVPVAVVRTAAGHFFWVDEEGVALGEMKPADSIPSFFIRGWNEEGTDEARSDNTERVQKYLEVAREWSAMGLAERVSEVNLTDVRDVRAQLAGDDSQIEVRLGGQELGARLKQALDTLDQYRQTPRGSAITYLDLQTGRIVIGSSSGNKVSTGIDAPVADSTVESASPTPSAKPAGTANANRRSSDSASTNDQQPKLTRSNPGRDSANKPRSRSR
jgi:cell division septal protein FtsQ